MKPKTTMELVLWMFGCIGLVLWNSSPVAAFSNLTVTVEVIKADRNSEVVDPQLKDLVKELGPVLNYTGFSLLKKSDIRLGVNKKDEIILPDDRRLELELLGFEADKGRLSVKILQNGKEIFRTVLLMVDKGSAMIGGPPHEGGVLLLRIGAEF